MNGIEIASLGEAAMLRAVREGLLNDAKQISGAFRAMRGQTGWTPEAVERIAQEIYKTGPKKLVENLQHVPAIAVISETQAGQVGKPPIATPPQQAQRRNPNDMPSQFGGRST